MFLRSRVDRLVVLAALAAAAVFCVGAGSASAAWPGSNGPIVFAGGGASAGDGLWSIRPNGRHLRRLTTDPSDSEVQTSPDGRWIVFVRSVDVDGSAAKHIFIARANGSGVAEVTTGPVFDRSPSFSRSGRRILFTRFISSGGEKSWGVESIFGIRRDGSGLHRLTSGPYTDRDPVMSPNGRIIAFDRAGSAGVSPHVYTMRPDGSRVVNATPRLAAWSSQPDFSPSGNRIVFVRGYPGAANADLFTMRPDGKRWRRLTGRANNPAGRFLNPSYSPDGRFVVAERGSEVRLSSKLRVIRVRDRSRVAVLGGSRTPRAPDMQNPAWLAR